jgi:TonB family protein
MKLECQDFSRRGGSEAVTEIGVRSMRIPTAILGFLLSSLLSAFGKPSAPDMSPTASNAKVPARSILAAPTPPYPPEARRNHWTGIGWYAMIVDTETGSVTSVRVLQSSGHLLLDRAAIDTFRRWRFKPHSTPKFMVPAFPGATPVFALAHSRRIVFQRYPWPTSSSLDLVPCLLL